MTTFQAMRCAAGATQQEIASRAGMSRQMLGRIERGERPLYPWEVHQYAAAIAGCGDPRRKS